LSTLISIADLLKKSEGIINIEQVGELEFFEFVFFNHYFDEEYSKKQEILNQDKKDMNDLIVEGITALYKAMRG
jgi:hypothetical protein